MAIKELIILPDPLLREISAPVERVDDDLKILVADMFETMYDAPGIGLAAIQIGVPRRIVVVDLAKGESEPDPMVFINPQIVRQSEEISIVEEGCLSIPDYLAEVERPASVVVEYQDLSGERIEIEADEMLATCLQHEIDHLDGKLFIDHISRLKRNMVVRKFTKNARAKATL